MLSTNSENLQESPSTNSPAIPQTAPQSERLNSPTPPAVVMENARFFCYADSTFIGTETRIVVKKENVIEIQDLSSLQMNRSATPNSPSATPKNAPSVTTASATVAHQEKLTATGELLHFSTEVAMGGAPTRYEGSLHPASEDGTRVVPVSISCRGISQTQSMTLRLPSTQTIFGAYGLETSFLLHPLKPGDSRTLIRLNPTMLQWEILVATCLSVENVELLAGKTYPLCRIETSSQILNSDGSPAGQDFQKELIWCDGNGLVWKRFSPLMNLSSWRSSPELIEKYEKSAAIPSFPLAENSGVAPSNLAEALNVPIAFHSSRKDLANASEVVYRIVAPETPNRAVIKDLFGNADFQSVEIIDDFTLKITVRNSDSAPLNHSPAANALPTDDEKLPSPIIQCDAPKITRLAASVLPNENDPQKLAEALESFVFRFIQNKNYSRGFVTALEVAENPTGDCTEHAVLLAALARARNIPARIAQGLVFDPLSGKMAWHVWNELFLNDRWIPFDATIGKNRLTPDHIRINAGSFSAASLAQTLLPPARLVGKIEITVENVQ